MFQGLRRIAFVSLCLAAATAAQAGAELQLKAGSFDPTRQLPAVPAELRLSDSERSASGVRILQFDRIPDETIRAAIERRGGRVLDYLPDNALLVRLPAGALSRISELEALRWNGVLEPAWKLSDRLSLDPATDEGNAETPTRVIVDLWRDVDSAAIRPAMESVGLTVINVWTNHGLRRAVVEGNPAQLRAAARLTDVGWIEPVPQLTMRNATTSWVMQSFQTNFRPIWDQGLHGEGQILGNIDGRLDMDSCYFDDNGELPGPLHRKVVAYRSSSGFGADNHGTHTVGTMVGDTGVPGEFDAEDGNAYAAKVSFGNVNDVTGFGGAPSNLLQYLNDAHADGARVHGNSWGDDGTTNYTGWSHDIDEFSWNNEDSLVVFAVTNGGSLRTPENAKNVLAVGATQRGNGANSHCSGGDGPTSDGRRKPEIYTPGCSTLSAAAGQACDVRASTGTSMACPAISAAGALVRQYFTEGWYPTGQKFATDSRNPTGAMVKAVLINGAVDMTGVSGYPSNREGWGRLVLDRPLYFDGDSRDLVWIDDVRRADGLSTGQSVSYSLDVTGTAEDLRITLNFTEPPAALQAATATINNLDLVAEAPDGTIYLGNVMSGGQSVPGGTTDGINNLEQIILDAPQTGVWTITVEADSVPVGPQGFALVASGELGTLSGGPRLRKVADRPIDPLGNADDGLDPGETLELAISQKNFGLIDGTGVQGTLKAVDPDLVRITRTQANWPDVVSGGTAESAAPHFEMIVSPDVECGSSLAFELETSTAEAESDTQSFTIEIPPVDQAFIQEAGAEIPALTPDPILSVLSVSAEATIAELDVSVAITHWRGSELIVELTSPEGTTVRLHNQTPGTANGLEVRYDLDRQPDGPGTMADFIGEELNGEWTLAITDANLGQGQSGSLNRWELHVETVDGFGCDPFSCTDPVPGPVDDESFRVSATGGDLEFSWNAVSGAGGYHVLEQAAPQFDDPLFTGGTDGATTLTIPGGRSGAGITYYIVRATNSCGWEGP
ncbi:hypothetical protein ABI59_11545 [Acidobacteria bacterium Mor1]|nr:hypothetical protein ABI59_11545 [Acidobacteria bacterium Mor1]